MRLQKGFILVYLSDDRGKKLNDQLTSKWGSRHKNKIKT